MICILYSPFKLIDISKENLFLQKLEEIQSYLFIINNQCNSFVLYYLCYYAVAMAY